MKKLFKNISSIFGCLIVLAPIASFARPVALITKVEGKVFFRASPEAQLAPISTDNGPLEVIDNSEIFSEENGYVEFQDYQNRFFKLAGGGQIQFFQNIVTLKNGFLWFKYPGLSTAEGGRRASLFVQTANSIASSSPSSEGIFSFDSFTGQTQLLSLAGRFEFANILEQRKTVVVEAGEFSAIRAKENNGIPRIPSEIGPESFAKLAQFFKSIEKMNTDIFKAKKIVDRSIASQGADTGPRKKKEGKIIYVGGAANAKKKMRSIASEKIRPGPKRIDIFSQASKVELKIYGIGLAAHKKKSAPSTLRSPASQFNTGPKVDTTFQNSLQEHSQAQRKHSDELRALINELKSFQDDYKK